MIQYFSNNNCGKMNIPMQIYYPPGTPTKYLDEKFLLTEPPKITDY